MNVTKDSAFVGLEDLVPEELRGFVVELSRRLEKYATSQFYQLRSAPTLFTNAADDPPEGPKEGDAWITVGGVYRYSGTAWESV